MSSLMKCFCCKNPLFSRSGVSLAEVESLRVSFIHAKRWLLPDGTTHLGVELTDDGAFTTPRAAPVAGAIEILACGGEVRSDGSRTPGEIVARSDGRLVAVDSVVACSGGGGELLYIVRVLKTYRVPTPCARDAAGRPCLGAAVRIPCIDELPPPSIGEDRSLHVMTIRAEDIAPARHLATLDDLLQHVVKPLTTGEDATSLADTLGGSRDALIFLSWSFRNRIDCFVDAFRAFLAEHRRDPATCFAWVSMLCVDQSDAYQAQLDPFDWAREFMQLLQSIGHTVVMFSPWNDAAVLHSIWCLWEIFVTSQSKGAKLTVQLPVEGMRHLTRRLVLGTATVPRLLEHVSIANAHSRHEVLGKWVRGRVQQSGGAETVDVIIRDALRASLVFDPTRSGAVIQAGFETLGEAALAARSSLRGIVLTQEQGALVHGYTNRDGTWTSGVFKDDDGCWCHGRWRINAAASSGKSYIAMYLAVQWAKAAAVGGDGGASLLICHHEGMRAVMAAQVCLELGEGATVEPCDGGDVEAAWVRSDDSSAAVLVATIDGLVDVVGLEEVDGVLSPPTLAPAWRGRFAGSGVVVDEAQVVFGRETRPDVAGQHRLFHPRHVSELVDLLHSGDDGSSGRLAILGDANQLNENPFDAEALEMHRDDIGFFEISLPEVPDLKERAAAAAWPVSPPVYPTGCAEIGAEVTTLLQMNLRNSHTVRDSSVLLHNEFARDGTLQPLHPDSAEGRPLETVEVVMVWGGERNELARRACAPPPRATRREWRQRCSRCTVNSAAMPSRRRSIDQWWRCSRPTIARIGEGQSRSRRQRRIEAPAMLSPTPTSPPASLCGILPPTRPSARASARRRRAPSAPLPQEESGG